MIFSGREREHDLKRTAKKAVTHGHPVYPVLHSDHLHLSVESDAGLKEMPHGRRYMV
jgi:hypothetical protein